MSFLTGLPLLKLKMIFLVKMSENARIGYINQSVWVFKNRVSFFRKLISCMVEDFI